MTRHVIDVEDYIRAGPSFQRAIEAWFVSQGITNWAEEAITELEVEGENRVRYARISKEPRHDKRTVCSNGSFVEVEDVYLWVTKPPPLPDWCTS